MEEHTHKKIPTLDNVNKGIAKMTKNNNSHDGFLRADQDRLKNCCQMARIGYAILQVAQKALVVILFLACFCNSLIKYEKSCQNLKILGTPQTYHEAH